MVLPLVVPAKDGHRLLATYLPPFNTAKIDLLLNRGEVRKIAVINRDKNTLYVKRSTRAHLHRKMNSFGFNHELLSNRQFPFDQVHMTVDKKKRFLIPREWITENAEFLHHKKEGFELQIFININLLKQFSV